MHYTQEKITSLHFWTDYLFSFRTTKSKDFSFLPGQFTRLGVRTQSEDIIWRPYSMVNISSEEELEFYSVVVPEGAFTQIIKNWKVGDEVLIDQKSYGLLTLERFSQVEKDFNLWLLSTGTGIAPFISILSDSEVWQKYANVILVHSVRHKEELAYESYAQNLAEKYPQLCYLRLLSRATEGGDLYGRITTLLLDGQLEATVRNKINVASLNQNSKIMLCGNPDMVLEVRQILGNNYGLQVAKRGQPGSIAVENMW